MTRTALAHLIRLGRWPRRIAAALCLLLAAASALSAQHPQRASAADDGPRHAGVTARLHAGQVAVPVTLSDGTASGYLHAGDRVDLFATVDNNARSAPQPAALVGRRLLVIAVPAASRDSQETDGTHVIVAADRVTAARLAGLAGFGVLAVLAKYP